MPDVSELQITKSISPLAAWLRDLPQKTRKTWGEIAAIADVSVDQLRRLRTDRAKPRARTLKVLFGAFGEPDWGAEQIEQAGQRALAQGQRRRSERAECERCGIRERVSQVRGLPSFREAEGGQSATFTHPRRCRPRPDNPFVPAIDAARSRLGRPDAPDADGSDGVPRSTWHPVLHALQKAGVKVDLFRILSGKTVPKPDLVPAIAKALQVLPEDEARWGEASRRYWDQRRRTHTPGPAPTSARATCRGCPREVLVSKVRHVKSAEFREGPPATYLCRECRKTRMTTLVCPIVGCAKPPRSEYKSRNWKRRHRDQRRDDGAYWVPDDECHRKIMGTFSAPELRERLWPRFEEWFRAQRQAGAASDDDPKVGAWFANQRRVARPVPARAVWDGAAPDPPASEFARGFRSSQYAKRFTPPPRDGDESPEAQRLHNVNRALYQLIVKAWGRVRMKDMRARRGNQRGVQRGPLGNLQRWVDWWTWWAESTYRAGDRLSLKQIERLNQAGRPPSPTQVDGTEPLSKAQAVLLSGVAPPLARCDLCTKLLNTKAHASRVGRRLHTGDGLCSDVWRRSPEYRAQWTARRWGAAAPDVPIAPPQPPWVIARTTAKGLARKCVWFLKHYVFNKSFSAIADETMEIAEELGNPSQVSAPAVKQGVDDFMAWLPADLSVASLRPAIQRLVEDALEQSRRAPRPRPLRRQRARATEQRERDARLMRWLGGRWKMSLATVARLVRVSPDEGHARGSAGELNGRGGGRASEPAGRARRPASGQMSRRSGLGLALTELAARERAPS